MTNYSQRDSRWKDIPLGFPKAGQTIGGYGCTITSLGNLIDTAPDIINEKLKMVQGFQESSILWTKINEAFPFLQFIWRGYTYENEKVLQAINDNKGCLVEVDGTPIGGLRHWVLYIGNKKLIDPWDGKEKETTTYKAVGYSIIKVLEIKDDLQDELDKCRLARDSHWDDLILIKKALELSENSLIDTMLKSINAYKGNANKAEELEKQLTTIKTAYESQLAVINQQCQEKDILIEQLQIQQNDVVAPYIEQLKAKGDQIIAMAEEIKTLKLANPTCTIWSILKKLIKR